ncbi:hypothetical protein [Nocardia sp. NBC_01388]|uniref:hypothetical protein n=1 Tax=Nocardia sp. NBC_01388 TaxID=2903596 RepID=UPI003244DC8A
MPLPGDNEYSPGFGRGSFGHASVLGTTLNHWAPGAYAEPIMGCPAAGQHVWAAVQTENTRALPIRHFMNEAAVRFLVYDAPIGEDFEFRPETGYGGLCEVGFIDDEWGIYQLGRPPRFRFTTSDRAGRWVERGVLDLEFAHDQEALQFATPDADEPLVYLARKFRITGGTYRGEPVEDGYVFHEQVYVRSGHSWALTAYKRELQGVWLAFVTRYEDGAVDWGQICYGTRGWSFAIVISSGSEPILVSRPEGDVEFDADGNPVRARFLLGDSGWWTWRPHAHGGGRVPLPGPPEHTPRWAEGQVTKRDETRRVEFSHTWWESYQSHLT